MPFPDTNFHRSSKQRQTLEFLNTPSHHTAASHNNTQCIQQFHSNKWIDFETLDCVVCRSQEDRHIKPSESAPLHQKLFRLESPDACHASSTFSTPPRSRRLDGRIRNRALPGLGSVAGISRPEDLPKDVRSRYDQVRERLRDAEADLEQAERQASSTHATFASEGNGGAGSVCGIRMGSRSHGTSDRPAAPPTVPELAGLCNA